jgi:uncharacterized protein with von Willebrand factor type A (vWA) domain
MELRCTAAGASDRDLLAFVTQVRALRHSLSPQHARIDLRQVMRLVEQCEANEVKHSIPGSHEGYPSRWQTVA